MLVTVIVFLEQFEGVFRGSIESARNGDGDTELVNCCWLLRALASTAAMLTLPSGMISKASSLMWPTECDRDLADKARDEYKFRRLGNQTC